MKKNILPLLLLFLPVYGYGQNDRPYVLLVSFDGFRSDYVEKLDLPNFKAFIRTGTRAEYMRPSFPSMTFPNHYTIVTGMNPGTHGLVDNTFYDPEKKATYRIRDREKVSDKSFYGGTPIWQLARQSGMKTASYFWVGSEMSDVSRNPDYFFSYVDSIPFSTRIRQVITWLQLPEKERPHFITLYFSEPDHDSHANGPWADKTIATIRKMDAYLGDLMKGLESVNLPVNTILVSDHGMTEVKVEPEYYVFVDEILKMDAKGIVIAGGETQQHIYFEQKNKIDSVYDLLKKQETNFKVFRRTEFPEEWHYQNERSGDILLTANPGYSFRKGREAFLKLIKAGTLRGEHGYDPKKVDDMRAIFYASGPNIKSGLIIPSFQNVDIFPLIARILQLKLPKIDGNPETLKKVYRKK